MTKDYYQSLGVDKNASADEIKRVFRDLAQKYHPDKPGGDAQKFKEINEAYQILSDPTKRVQYDQYGNAFEQARSQGQSGFDNFNEWMNYRSAGGFGSDQGFSFNFGGDEFDLGDIFGDIFGFGGGATSRAGKSSRRRKGSDLEIVLNLEFKEAIFGVEKEINVERYEKCKNCDGSGADPHGKIIICPTCKGVGQVMTIKRTFLGQMQSVVTCPDCHGEGKKAEKSCKECRGDGRVKIKEKLMVKIPAGIDDKQAIRLSGKGNAGQKGGVSGDLYVIARATQDKYFTRKENNLYSEQEIFISQAVLGDQIKVKTVDGEVLLKIPVGTKSGSVFNLREKGVPYIDSRRRGDHLVTINIDIPKHLNRKQKELLEELRRMGI